MSLVSRVLFFFIIVAHVVEVGVLLGLQIDSKIFNFICDPIQKIIKIIQFVFVFEEIRICICIRKILTDMNTIWLLAIHNCLFSYYPLISDRSNFSDSSFSYNKIKTL
jgi:hypothetical protein